MKRKAMQLAVAAALFPALLAGCSNGIASIAAGAASAQRPSFTRNLPNAAPSALPDFVGLVARVGPSVVNISTTETGNAAAQMPQLDQNDPFFEFFKHFNIPQPQQGPMHGIGSGFIISPDGYILTNAHVVKDATEVDVKLTDRREFKAKVVGTDPLSDVALLKIDASGLPALKIGDSSKIKVGQWVLAVGSPFGFENSVTAGIVSAKSRALPGDSYVPFIQTDVAVNPGNSGGPLFNADGQVIGINSQIYSRSGGYMGLSFAVPINVAMNVENQLQHFGKATHGRLGIGIQEVNQDLAQSFGLKKPAGALVGSVEDGSPAARAGIKSGDVILAFDGKDIDSSSELPLLVGSMKPGQSASVKIWRDHAERTLRVSVGAMPTEQVAANDAAGANSGKLGVEVRSLTPAERRDLHAHGGVLVEQTGGAAARAGIQSGDVILAVNNKPVSGVAELRRQLDESGKHVALLVRREDETIYVPVDLG
ncbi:MAG: DegQ family serine endoprotease [Burkholderiales bacterium]|nr:DegQ family serine endoprotease [Burkholderiales bacterium]